MSVKLEQVRHWCMGHGNVGHIAAFQRHGWVYTLCRTYGPNEVIKKRPKRLCRKCVAALKDVNIPEPKQEVPRCQSR